MGTMFLSGVSPLLRFSQLSKTVSALPSLSTQKRFYAKKKKTGKDAKTTKKKEIIEKPKAWVKAKLDETVVKFTRDEIERSYAPSPVDNVWITKKHRPQLFNLTEILKMHRETHHPTIYNEPNGKLYATLDLDMSLSSTKSKTVEHFRGVIALPNYFDAGVERRILCICKDTHLQEEARKAGAVLSGGADIIKMFKESEVTHDDFDYIVVHPDMIVDLTSIRGLIKHHFPTKQRGNLGPDVVDIVKRFIKGVDYKSNKDVFEPRYATTDVLFGRLSMEDKAIEENLVSVLSEIKERRPPDVEVETPFIVSVNIWSPPSPEKLYVNYWQYHAGYNHNYMLSKYTTLHYQQP